MLMVMKKLGIFKKYAVRDQYIDNKFKNEYELNNDSTN